MRRPYAAGIILLVAGLLAVGWWFKGAPRATGEVDSPAAAAVWRRLALLFPGSAGIAYNSGVALYRQGEYRRAAAEFSRASREGDPEMRGAACYNLGNALFRQGDRLAAGDRSGAAEFYRQAVEQYDEALRLNGAAPDARFNRAVAEGRHRALRAAPPGQPGEKPGGASRREEGQQGRAERVPPVPGGSDAAARAAAGDPARNRTARQAGGDGRNGAGAPQPISMTRRDAEALLREHRSAGGATAIFRDGGWPDGSSPVLKDW